MLVVGDVEPLATDITLATRVVLIWAHLDHAIIFN